MGKREPVVTSCDQLSFDAMAAFIGSLNGNAGDHIGYFDISASASHHRP
jgi:hypothetical protein